MILTEGEKLDLKLLVDSIKLERDGHNALEEIINISDSLLTKLEEAAQ